MELAHVTDLVLTTATLLLWALLLSTFLVCLVHVKTRQQVAALIEKRGVVIALFLVTAATASSLWYSEVVGFDPCRLCWYQRIAMFPMVFILVGAMIDKTRRVVVYTAPLLAIGLIIAVYHWLLQFGFISKSLDCGVVGQSSSCSGRWVVEYGFVSIPFMAGTIFFTTLLVLLIQARVRSNK